MERYRKNGSDDVTSATLRRMDAAMHRFHTLFLKIIAPHMKSKGKTIKLHKNVHAAPVCRRLGHPREYGAQFYEQAHAFSKQAYRHSSRRRTADTYLAEMVSQCFTSKKHPTNQPTN